MIQGWINDIAVLVFKLKTNVLEKNNSEQKRLWDEFVFFKMVDKLVESNYLIRLVESLTF